MTLTIAKLAEAGDVGVETIRYYQRRGLLAEPARGPNGAIRRYGADDVRRLRFIRQAQGAGFTLKEVAELLALDAGHDRAQARALAERRIAAIEQQIAVLAAARDALSSLADNCAREEAGPCPILAAFDPPPGAADRG